MIASRLSDRMACVTYGGRPVEVAGKMTVVFQPRTGRQQFHPSKRQGIATDGEER
jgi:hypothetical protein